MYLYEKNNLICNLGLETITTTLDNQKIFNPTTGVEFKYCNHKNLRLTKNMIYIQALHEYNSYVKTEEFDHLVKLAIFAEVARNYDDVSDLMVYLSPSQLLDICCNRLEIYNEMEVNDN